MSWQEGDPGPVVRAPAGEGGLSAAERAPLIGAGVDAERVARFEKLASGDRPWRHVYSPREADHLAALPQAALAFCAAFCAKEALCKALGGAYPFRECECLYVPGAVEQELVISSELRGRHGLALASVRFHGRYPPEREECVAEMHLFGAPAGGRRGSGTTGRGEGTVRSRLDSIAIAAVDAERGRLEQEHFSAAELADLGTRRVQSLAGSLALKRALLGLWLDVAGNVTRPQPRDFQLGHLASGAPCLLAAPPGPAPERVRVSIAHTRGWAYGLAAID